MPEAHQFLTPEWLAAVQAIREEYRGRIPAGTLTVRMNQVVTGVPFGAPTMDAHIDTTSGEVEMAPGALEDPEVTVTVDYETARAIFVDPSSAMAHFMGGRIKVQGDMTRLLALIQANPDPAAVELQQRLAEVTAPSAPPEVPEAPEAAPSGP
ncbi:MAG: SCP2 sterol-binding domain-containing protein [Acidimicrobiales bacterium]